MLSNQNKLINKIDDYSTPDLSENNWLADDDIEDEINLEEIDVRSLHLIFTFEEYLSLFPAFLVLFFKNATSVKNF